MKSGNGVGRGRRLAALGGIAVLAAAGCGGSTEAEAEPEETEQQEESLSPGEVLEETAPDGHPLREIPAEEAPSLELEAEPDDHGGWNIHLVTEGFEFTPEETGGSARGGQGHAHLYVDGEKFARLYGPWFHLPQDAAGDGESTLTATLNANDHTTWAVDGAPLEVEQEIDSADAAEPHDHDEDEDEDDEEHEHDDEDS